MILYPKHNIYLSNDSFPIFKDGEKCVLSMSDIPQNIHSENGYALKGVKYMIYNYSNIDNRIEFFTSDDYPVSMDSVREFLKNFMREDEFRMQQIVSNCKGKISIGKLELLK